MSRARQLKPSFFMDEDVACLSFPARLLFQGLWTLADRRGRLEDRPAWIRVQVFPYDDLETAGVTFASLMDELAAPRKHREGGFVLRYSVGGKDYILIRNFERHQHPHPKEQESQIPPPEIDTEKPRKAAAKRGEPRNSGTCRAVPSVPSVPSFPSGSTSERTTDAAAVAPAPRTLTWTQEAVLDWDEVNAPGSGPHGKIGAGIEPLIKHHDWPSVIRPAWRRYLRETTHPKPSAQDFRETFGKWLPGRPGAGNGAVRAGPGKSPVGDRTVAALARYEARRADAEGHTAGDSVRTEAEPSRGRLPPGA